MMVRRKIDVAVLFGALFVFSSLSAQPSGPMLMSPYLQAVTTNSIYVLVESSTTDTVWVEYGLSTSYGLHAPTQSCDTTTEKTFVHNVKLSGLTANTPYHYRAHQGGSVSDDATFRTAPNPGTPFRFAWMADCRSGNAVHDSISKRIADAHPVMSLYGGDIAGSSTYPVFKSQFFRAPELALIARVPFFNTPGNHERWTPNTEAFTEAPASPSGTQAYYSLDYGDMHVLAVNTEISYKPGSPQYLFAEQDLAASKKPWKIVICHKPAYCAGGHGEDSLMIIMSEKVFVPNHVDMVLSGHSHFFEHNLVSGIHHMIIGSAGAPLYNLGTAPYVLKSAKDYNYAIFDVTPTTFSMVVYNAGGVTLDSLVLNKHDSKSPSTPGKSEGSLIRQPSPEECDCSAWLRLDAMMHPEEMIQ